MRLIVLEGDTPNLVERLEEGLVFDAIGIEPAPIRKLLEPGSPVLPGPLPPFEGLLSTGHDLQLLLKGLGNQILEWAPLLSGKCLGFT